MRDRRAMIKPMALVCALLLLGVFGAPVCFADSFPEISKIGSMNQLVQWHHARGKGLASLKQDVEITGLLTLEPSAEGKGLNTYDWTTQGGYCLRVMPGATLIVDNPNIELCGEEKIITVESGGRLVLRQGVVFAGDGKNNAVAVVVKMGGNVMVESGFRLIGDIQDGNNALPSIPPPDPRVPITNIFDDQAHLACAVGERPDPSRYLATVYVYFGGTEREKVPLTWDLSTVDFQKPGTYTVIGRLTQQGLDEKNLSNPENFTARMTITVYEKGPLKDLRGEFLSVDSRGGVISRLILPALPIEQISAVYVYQSADQRVWKKATCHSFPVDGAVPTDENFLPVVRTVGSSSYLAFRYQTDYRPLWVRVEIVGSDHEGMSNAVRVVLPDGAGPGDIVHEDSDGDDGSSGGNRGGVGQVETDRVLPQTAEQAGAVPAPEALAPADQPVLAAAGGAVQSLPGIAVPEEAADKLPENPPKIMQTPEDAPVMAELRTPLENADAKTNPVLPSAGTVALGIAGAVAVGVMLSQCYKRAHLKWNQRKL